MTIAQAVVEILQQEEVPFVAGLPGSGVMDYLDVLYSARSPRFVLVRHEQVGVHMALGYAEYTGRPAAMLVSRSPGSSNAVIGVQAAWAEGSPLVLISSHVNSEARGLGAFQEIDLESLFRPITKMSVEVRDAQRVPSVLQEAFRVAVSGRPGPVHVSIPLNFPSHEFEGRLSVPARQVVGRSLPSTAAVAEIVRHLQGARRPAIIAGGGVTKSGAAASVMKLAERIGAAVTNSWEKKAVAETHHLATGNIGRGGSGASAAVLHEADVIIALGFRFSEFATEDYRMRFGPGQTLIQVDIDAAAVGRVFPVQVGVAADAKSTVDMVLEELGGDGGAGGDPEWIARIAQHRADWAARIADVAWEADPII
ncbi:MAG: thiamine pyrophosphate-binding protein, partial [Candidatus Dormibacteraceae bacterium]